MVFKVTSAQAKGKEYLAGQGTGAATRVFVQRSEWMPGAQNVTGWERIGAVVTGFLICDPLVVGKDDFFAIEQFQRNPEHQPQQRDRQEHAVQGQAEGE